MTLDELEDVVSSALEDVSFKVVIDSRNQVTIKTNLVLDDDGEVATPDDDDDDLDSDFESWDEEDIDD